VTLRLLSSMGHFGGAALSHQTRTWPLRLYGSQIAAKGCYTSVLTLLEGLCVDPFFPPCPDWRDRAVSDKLQRAWHCSRTYNAKRVTEMRRA